MNTVCKKDGCTGCMACIAGCSQKAIRIEDNMLAMNAVIDADTCVNCGLCRKVCQVNDPLQKTEPIMWFEGWAKDSIIRSNSTSGGFATAIMDAFIESGGEVCSCTFTNGKFCFMQARTVGDTKAFSGSKYCKSNPEDAYEIVKTGLLKGKKVLFVGLPCQVAGIQKSIKPELQTNLYTIDLICHGTPSVKALNRFLKDEGIEMSQLRDLRFRCKANETRIEGYKTLAMESSVDAFTYSFLKQINFTENCYACAYSQTGRISDLTLGDSWGSKETAEVSKGISLALCQNEKGFELLKSADLVLKDVDVENAVTKNAQLVSMARRPEERDMFFSQLKSGKNYKRVVHSCYPMVFMKQRIKEMLIRMKLLRGEKKVYRITYLQKVAPKEH